MGVIHEPHRVRHNLADIVPLSTPYVMFIDICDLCNFRCGFCPSNNSTVNNAIRHKIMGFELFKKIVDDMTSFEDKVRVVNLYAYGEPLINPSLCDMIAYLRERNVCDEIRVTSNGSLLTSDLCDKLVKSGLDMFRLSLYGLSEEEYLQNTGVSVDYTAFKEQIAYLHRASKENNSSLRISVKAASSFITTEESCKLLDTEFSAICDYLYIESIEEVWPEYEMDRKYQLLPFVRQKYRKLERLSLCSYIFTTMMVYSNGDVGICDIDWQHSTRYGSVVDKSIVDLWNSKDLNEIRLRFCSISNRPSSFCMECSKIFDDNIDDNRGTIINQLKTQYQ